MSQPVGTAARVRLQNDMQKLETKNTFVANDLQEIQQRIDDRNEGQDGGAAQVAGTGRMPNESRRDYLVRTGKITPFAKMSTGPNEGPLASLRDALVDAEDERDEKEALEQVKSGMGVSHRNLTRPGFGFDEGAEIEKLDRPKKRRKVQSDDTAVKREDEKETGSPEAPSDEEYVASEQELVAESDEDFVVEDEEIEEKKKPTKKAKPEEGMEDLSGLDDGNEAIYQTRLQNWISSRSATRKRALDARRAAVEQNPDEAQGHIDDYEKDEQLEDRKSVV